MSYTYEVPLSYTVDVSLSATPSGLADFNTNSIAIFSNEQAGFSESYQAYITPAAVETDFGTDSLTAKMANALFTPVPNFRTGGGYLYIFPFKGVNATAGSLTTGDVSGIITTLKEVTNGALALVINGVSTQLSGLDFSAINELEDVATVITSQNPDIYVTVEDDTKLVFTSRLLGEDSKIIAGTVTGDDYTDIGGESYLNLSAATAVTGANASGETLQEAVKAALQQVYFGGVLTTQYTDNETRIANATAIQSLDVVYFDEITSMKNITTLGSALKNAELSKSRTLAYSVDMTTAKVAAATYATIAKSVNYDGSDTANTLNLKTLTGVSADTGLSDTYVLAANNNGVDIYGSTGGLSVVYSNDNNGYTDDIEANLWQKKATEVAGFNYLRQTNTKIPQTETGMSGLKEAYREICKQAVTNGTSAPGTWNGSIPFGDPEAFKTSIEQTGYYIYSIPVSEQSQTDREARKAPVVQIAIKRSGALHSSQVIINVQR